MKKIFIIAIAAAMLLCGCGKDKKKTEATVEDKPKNILSYEDKDPKELIPSETEEHGTVIEADPSDDEVPDEEELGEYQHVFMGDTDVVDDGCVGGWVLKVSLKDITINTDNVITTYELDDGAVETAGHLKPGDAALVNFFEAEDGTKVAYELSRVRTEDEALTKDEILEMYGEQNAD